MGVEGMRVNALTYLILYNLMFITPLLIVFGFVYWGTTSMQLGGALQRHLMPVKLGTGVLLLGLGVWLLLSIVIEWGGSTIMIIQKSYQPTKTYDANCYVSGRITIVTRYVFLLLLLQLNFSVFPLLPKRDESRLFLCLERETFNKYTSAKLEAGKFKNLLYNTNAMPRHRYRTMENGWHLPRQTDEVETMTFLLWIYNLVSSAA